MDTNSLRSPESQMPYQETIPHVKRGIGCSEINATEYTTMGVTFNLICDTRWPASNYLYLDYTLDFKSCIDGCAIWNQNGSGNCVGVTWIQTMYGPNGSTGGSACYFDWNFQGKSTQSTGWDNAILQNVVLPTTTTSSSNIPKPTDTECLSLNGSIYHSGTGSDFDVFCGLDWDRNDIFLSFQPDFFTCMDACALSNRNETAKCVGISWDQGNYGPKGQAGGSQCVFKWQMPGNPIPNAGSDDGRLVELSTPMTTTLASTHSVSASTTTSSFVSSNKGLSSGAIGGIAGASVGGMILFSCGLIAVLLRKSSLIRAFRDTVFLALKPNVSEEDSPSDGGRLSKCTETANSCGNLGNIVKHSTRQTAGGNLQRDMEERHGSHPGARLHKELDVEINVSEESRQVGNETSAIRY